jgi:hypothetical protein
MNIYKVVKDPLEIFQGVTAKVVVAADEISAIYVGSYLGENPKVILIGTALAGLPEGEVLEHFVDNWPGA